MQSSHHFLWCLPHMAFAQLRRNGWSFFASYIHWFFFLEDLVEQQEYRLLSMLAWDSPRRFDEVVMRSLWRSQNLTSSQCFCKITSRNWPWVLSSYVMYINYISVYHYRSHSIKNTQWPSSFLDMLFHIWSSVFGWVVTFYYLWLLALWIHSGLFMSSWEQQNGSLTLCFVWWYHSHMSVKTKH